MNQPWIALVIIASAFIQVAWIAWATWALHTIRHAKPHIIDASVRYTHYTQEEA